MGRCPPRGRRARRGRALAPILAALALALPAAAQTAGPAPSPGPPSARGSGGGSGADEVEALRARLAEAREAGAPPAERAGLLHDLGRALTREERYDEAAQAFEPALALREAGLPATRTEVMDSATGLGVARTSQGRHDEAEALFQRALELSRQAHDGAHPEVGTATSNLAGFYSQVGRFEDAEELYRQALRIHEEAGSGLAPTAVALRNLAGLLDRRGDRDEADALYRRILELYEQADPPRPGSAAVAHARVGERLRARGEAEEAERHFRAALEGLGGLEAAPAEVVVSCLDGLAWAAAQVGRAQEAEEFWTRALALGERFLGRDDPALAPVLESYAGWLRQTGREDEAGALERRAARLRGAADGRGS